MKCPDCGTRLAEIMVEGKLSHRCFKCGGFWADSETVNSLTSATLATWRRISVDPAWLSGGSNNCPQDQTLLQRYTGDSVPPEMVVKRCVRCGKWWFQGDTLHQFKPAQEIKQHYFRVWGTGGVSGLLLPMIAGAVLMVGLGAGVNMIQREQRVITGAHMAGELAIQYINPGQMNIIFEASEMLDKIEYRKMGEVVWLEALMYNKGTTYEIALDYLESGAVYEIKAGEKYFTFVAK